MAWELIQNNKFGPRAAVPKARNSKLAVISSFITVNWKHVRLDSAADGTPKHPFGEKLSLGLRDPDCACLFRLLESILCSVRDDSCYYNSVLFLCSIPSFLTSRREQNSFHPFPTLGIALVKTSPTFLPLSKSNPSPKHDPLNIWASEMHFSCKLNSACVE